MDDMLQSVLDIFPDAISQFGLLGCAIATYSAIALTYAAAKLLRSITNL